MQRSMASFVRGACRLTIEALESRQLLSADFLAGFPAAPKVMDHADHADHDEIDSLLRYDGDGNAYYFDPAPDFGEGNDGGNGNDGGTGTGDPREAEIPLLHSRPEAPKKIYLDFDGHIVTGTNWNNFNNGNPIHAPAYSIDGDITTFTEAEVNNIIQIWQRVSEDYAPFHVDVTTEEPPLSLFTQGNQAIRVLISTDRDDTSMGGTGNQWYSGAGGVAYLNSWTWTSDTPVWVFENNLSNGFPKYVAEAASHEVGHSLNLSHDGVTGGSSYYSGHGSGSTAWAPIMGVGYDRNLSQWSKGEYPNANNSQDDIAIIAGKLPFRADDHADNKTNAATATPLVLSGTTFSAAGVISQRTDVDVFRLTLSSQSTVTMSILPFSVGPNLDILAELFDASGTLVSSSNPVNLLSASFNLHLAAGTYTLAMDGIGKGDLTTGYSDYGSLGQYTISGTVIPFDPVPGGPFVPNTPVLNNPANPTQLSVTFSEALNPQSYSTFDDVRFYGPGEMDLSTVITSGVITDGNVLTLTFPSIPLSGTYRFEIGPQITDLAGNPMDQNQNGILGEDPGDKLIFEYLISGLTGDFNGNGLVNAEDIDLLCGAIMDGTNAIQFDLTGDGLVNPLDMDHMIRTVLSTEYGDANLDRFVDGSDFGIWNANKFQNGGWAQGNFTCDLVVDGSDFGLWNAYKFTGGGNRDGVIMAMAPLKSEDNGEWQAHGWRDDAGQIISRASSLNHSSASIPLAETTIQTANIRPLSGNTMDHRPALQYPRLRAVAVDQIWSSTRELDMTSWLD